MIAVFLSTELRKTLMLHRGNKKPRFILYSVVIFAYAVCLLEEEDGNLKVILISHLHEHPANHNGSVEPK